MADEGLTVRPEIEQLRQLLRAIGSDNEEERHTAEAGVKGAARLVSAIVACVRLENDLHPADDGGVVRSLDAILDRAAAVMEGGKHGADA